MELIQLLADCRGEKTTHTIFGMKKFSALGKAFKKGSTESHPIKVKTTAANDAAVVPEDF